MTSALFDIIDTPLRDLKVIQRKPIKDRRGYFERMFCAEDFQQLIPNRQVMQVNHTRSVSRGTVRGLHFQHAPHAEAKFVSCLRGEVFDVAVDVRRDSPTFLHWHAELLSGDNHRTLFVPEGFAHGFQALASDCHLLYFHTATHHPNAAAGLNVRDPLLAIGWPEAITELSPRDSSLPMLNEAFIGVPK